MWPDVRVAVFTDNDFEKVNGVTTTLREALRRAPGDVRLRVYTAASEAVDGPDYLAVAAPGMPIPFYGEMRMYLPRLGRFLRAARADRVDVVHLTTPGPVGLAALYVAWRLRLPLVGSFHTDLAAYTALLSGSGRLGTLMREYMRWPYGRCHRVLVPSEHTRDALVAAKTAPHKIGLWRRGVDTVLFDPAKRSRALREKWHVSDRRPALLFVGRVSREKGLGLLPRLKQRLHEMGLEHRFIVVGQGPMEAELRRLMPEAVFPGVLGRAAVADAFASADVFVFPSRTETAGNVVLEAQASGLPVVVSGAGAAREQMVPGLTGTVCAEETASAWANAVAGLVRDPARRAAASSAARAHALARTWDRALEPLYQTYREAALLRAPASPDVVPASVHQA